MARARSAGGGGKSEANPGTLAEFSARSLKRKLEGRERNGGKKKANEVPGHLARPGASFAGEGDTVGACGARAKAKGEGRDAGVEDAEEVEWEDIGEEDSSGEEERDRGDEGIDATEADVDVEVEVAVADPLSNRSFVRVWAVLVHRSHVLCLLGRGQHCDLCASDPMLSGLALSLLPSWLFPDPALARSDRVDRSHLAPMTTFFSKLVGEGKPAAAVPVAPQEEERAALRERVLAWFSPGSGGGGGGGLLTEEEASVLFAALCRGLGLRTRLVRVIDPAPKTPKRALEDYSAASASAPAAQAAEEDGEEGAPLVVEVTKPGTQGKRKCYGEWNLSTAGPKQKGRSAAGKTQFWAEVWCGAKGAWESVDPSGGFVGPCGRYESSKGLCVAFWGGRWKDVTQRYAADFHRRQRTVDWRWWEETKEAFREGGEREETEEDAALEERVLEQAKADWPKTLTAAKVHPYYVLFRHLRKNQALVPKPTFLGKFVGGEPLYLRAEVRDLRSAVDWERMGRRVRDEEVGRPARENDEGKQRLYGNWQTDLVVVEGGVIPRNSHGNVLCPPLVERLPEGLCHLKVPASVCKKLAKASKIADFAPAVVGFDRYLSASRPAFDRVVVLEQDQAAVVDAYLELELARAEAARKKRMRRATALWRGLLFGLLKRRELRERWGLEEKEVVDGKEEVVGVKEVGEKEEEKEEGVGVVKVEVEVEEI